MSRPLAEAGFWRRVAEFEKQNVVALYSVGQCTFQVGQAFLPSKWMSRDPNAKFTAKHVCATCQFMGCSQRAGNSTGPLLACSVLHCNYCK
jgi:hypothetical protein